MKTTIHILVIALLASISLESAAQTASSLFWRSDSLQVSSIESGPGDFFNKVGHHGPAVENSHMALRIYYNASGAIDVYSKTGRGLELKEYLWYPDKAQQDTLSAGADGYIVGKTVGLGGISLWDGENEVSLEAGVKRVANVGEIKNGSYAEVIAYGVPYKDDLVDISIRVEVTGRTREAVVIAEELSGKKVQFLTGVNFHENQKVSYGDGYIGVWGPHPLKPSETPFPVGAGMFYSSKMFPVCEKVSNMVRIISKPAVKVRTRVIAASSKEAELNSAKRFEAYMTK